MVYLYSIIMATVTLVGMYAIWFWGKYRKAKTISDFTIVNIGGVQKIDDYKWQVTVITRNGMSFKQVWEDRKAMYGLTGAVLDAKVKDNKLDLLIFRNGSLEDVITLR